MKKSIWLSILASGLLVIFLGSVVCSQEIPGKEVLDRITDSKVLHYHTMPGILARSKGDILEIFKYVRDEVAFESYQGSLRGVDGTLQARAGNSWDQAILLKALLDELGVACKLVRSRLPREYYQELKASSLLPAKAEKLLPDGFVKELKIGAKAGAEFNQSIAGYMGEVVKEAIAEHANINFQPLKMSSPGDALLLGDYLWVQAEIEEKVYDFHPIFPEGTTLVLDSVGVMNSRVSVPIEMSHWVRYRCFIERLSDSGVSRQLIFEKRIMASTSVAKAITFSLNPDPDDSGKITLSPALIRGTQILASKPISVRSSKNGSRLGSLTGVWLEITVLSPGERPRVSTVTLADSIPNAPLWMERKKLKATEVLVLPDAELFASLEMLLLTSGLPWEQGIEHEVAIYKKLGNLKKKTLKGLGRLKNGNPVLTRWGLYINPLLAELNSRQRAYLNAPAIAAALYKPIVHQDALHLISWCGLLHFRTSGEMEAVSQNGVAASLLLEKVAGVKDSLILANNRKRNKFELVKKPEAIKDLKDTWQRVALNELRVDLISANTVYLPTGKDVQYWWKSDKGSYALLLKGNAGWLKRWQVVESPAALTRNVSGEWLFFINNKATLEFEDATITEAMVKYISTHLSSFSLSPLKTLVDNIVDEKGNYAITEP